VRAFAVLAVLLYHGNVSWAGGGFLGVDAFFVLSGFLITALLLVEWGRTGRIDLRAFWARRARRLLPALLVVLAVVAGYAAVVAGEPELDRLRSDGLSTLFYVANWHQILSGVAYFDQFELPSALRHTWSLAIEEQWYFVWPFVFIGLLRLTGGRTARMLAGVGALAAASALLMVVLYQPGGDPARVYYGTDTRAQSLLIGAGLAVVWAWRAGPTTPWTRALLQTAGLGAAVYVGWLWVTSGESSASLYRGGLTTEAVAVAIVIAAVLQRTSPLGAFLGIAPLRVIGRISYGLYLWHWPLYVFLTPARTGLEGTELLTLRIACTVALAVASYNLVEMPVRNGAFTPRLARVVAPAGAAVVAMAMVLATSSLLTTTPSDTDARPPSEAQQARQRDAAGRLAAQPGTLDVLLAGDSVALALGIQYDPAIAANRIAVRTEGALGCGLLRGEIYSDGAYRFAQDEECDNWPVWWRGVVEGYDPDLALLLVGAWDVYDRRIDGELLRFESPEFESHFRAQLEETFAALSSGGAHVVFLTTPCFQPVLTDLGAWGTERGDPARIAALNRYLEEFAAARPGAVSVLDVNNLLCPEGQFTGELQGVQMHTDGVHFTRAGAELIWEWLVPQLNALGREYAPEPGSVAFSAPGAADATSAP
jgi:peptidoglycan/LPS O-acetylase OafA/YrhL